MGEPFLFDKPLKEGIIQKRNSRFTMDVMLNGEIVACHCPTTGRIGDIELKQVACLISENDNPKRKLHHTAGFLELIRSGMERLNKQDDTYEISSVIVLKEYLLAINGTEIAKLQTMLTEMKERF